MTMDFIPHPNPLPLGTGSLLRSYVLKSRSFSLREKVRMRESSIAGK
jgi:hypothetical protein